MTGFIGINIHYYLDYLYLSRFTISIIPSVYCIHFGPSASMLLESRSLVLSGAASVTYSILMSQFGTRVFHCGIGILSCMEPNTVAARRIPSGWNQTPYQQVDTRHHPRSTLNHVCTPEPAFRPSKSLIHATIISSHRTSIIYRAILLAHFMFAMC